MQKAPWTNATGASAYSVPVDAVPAPPAYSSQVEVSVPSAPSAAVAAAANEPAVRLQFQNGRFESFCPPSISSVISPSMFTEIIDSINTKLKTSPMDWWPIVLPILAIVIGIVVATSPADRPERSSTDMKRSFQEASQDHARMFKGAAIGMLGFFVGCVLAILVKSRQKQKRLDSVRAYLNEVNQHYHGRLTFRISEKASYVSSGYYRRNSSHHVRTYKIIDYELHVYAAAALR